jgi:predicted dienelactone hydrolase
LRRLVGAIGAAACLAAMPAVAASEESARIGGVDAVVWRPPVSTPGRSAVVIFSHALYLCPTQSRYLMEVLADAGYLVIAPRHTDSGCSTSVWPSYWRMSGKPWLLWGDDDFRDRAEDIRAIVAALPGHPRYGTVADATRLALVGHSLGGYTVLGLAGAWPSWRLPGVRAVVALTPYSMPFQRSEGLRRITVPTMYQAGTLDPVFTLPLEQFAYAQTPAPKYLVKVRDASHLAWTDLGTSDRDAIVGYTQAFLDRYVRDAEPSTALHAALAGASIAWSECLGLAPTTVAGAIC